MVCDVRYKIHIGKGDAHILSRDIGAVETVDEARECVEKSGCLVSPGISDDDRFAAAEIETCNRVLLGHPG